MLNGEIQLSVIGRIVSKYWQEIPSHFPHVQLDEFIIMPNHLHAIITIEKQVTPASGRDVACYVSTNNTNESNEPQLSTISPKPGSLGVIIRSFKAAVTLWCRKNGHSQFFWQSRYYDHIIRNDQSLSNIRHYIIHNVDKWDTDEYNPINLRNGI